MNIDEFLDSNKTTATVNDIDIIKINYNEKIDFIYKPEYKKIQYGYDLKFLGLFEKASKKLYGSYFIFQSDYYKDLYSRYFVSNIEDIEKNLINDANVCLNAYIKENQLQLMNIGKNIFNEYISDESNYEKIKDKAIHDYIYNLNNSELKFSIELNKNNIDIKELIIQYVESPIKTVKKVLDNYINNPDKYDRIYYNNKYHAITVKEDIGLCLLEKQLEYSLLENLKNNPNNEYKKNHDIITTIQNLESQMLSITIKHNKEIISFKYPKDLLNNLVLYESHIPNLTIRENISNLYKDVYGSNKHDIFIKEIIKIEYNKKIIYEDTELINEKNTDIETHDITDDMFE